MGAKRPNKTSILNIYRYDFINFFFQLTVPFQFFNLNFKWPISNLFAQHLKNPFFFLHFLANSLLSAFIQSNKPLGKTNWFNWILKKFKHVRENQSYLFKMKNINYNGRKPEILRLLWDIVVFRLVVFAEYDLFNTTTFIQNCIFMNFRINLT